jgi:hypothetical protein
MALGNASTTDTPRRKGGKIPEEAYALVERPLPLGVAWSVQGKQRLRHVRCRRTALWATATTTWWYSLAALLLHTVQVLLAVASGREAGEGDTRGHTRGKRREVGGRPSRPGACTRGAVGVIPGLLRDREGERYETRRCPSRVSPWR